MDKIALFGGRPLRTSDFVRWPQWDATEGEALQRVLAQGPWWRVAGGEVTAFEKEFAAFHGASRALAVTNGTAALEILLEMLDIGSGDEVIVPAFTFISTSIAVQRRGAIPIVADVDGRTYCLDPASFEASITPRTRAVIPVHMAGQVADMDAIDVIARRASVEVIQDAAHAHGARWRDRTIGELGWPAAFSFQNGKLMTAGEGGALLLRDDDEYERAFIMHSCGRAPDDRIYDHQTPSGNHRLTEFSGAVLRAQLQRLAVQLEQRAARWKALGDALASIPGVETQEIRPECTLNSHYMVMFCLTDEVIDVNRNQVVDALIAEGIPAFVNFPPVYRTRSFWPDPPPTGRVDRLASWCRESERIGSRGIWVHHRTLLGSEEDALDVARAIARVLPALAS